MSDPKALRAFLDVLSDAVLVLDRSVRVSFANLAATRLMACESGAPLRDLVPLLGESLVDAVSSVLMRGVPRLSAPRGPQVPEDLLWFDGRRFHVTLTPFEGERWALRLALRSAVAAAGVVPEAARAPAAPASLPSELLELLWDSPFPATLQDHRFHILEANQAYQDFTGFRLAQLLGRDPVDLQPEEDRAANRAERARHHPPEGTLPADPSPERLIERRLVDADGRQLWYRAARRKVVDARGQVMYLTLLQDNTAEHAARERADRSARELDDWFDLSPVGMVLFDDQGLVVRTNPAFEGLAGVAPVLMSDADPGIQALLAWEQGRPAAALTPGSNPVEAHAWITSADGGARRLRSIVRCYQSATGQRRYMAVLEDRSMEEERDLAQMQIGALMDTAGVGLATFQESSGWVQHGSGGHHGHGVAGSHAGGVEPPSAALQSIRRDVVMPESLPEYERLQSALRHAERAEVRYAIRHPDLGQRWLLTRVEPATLASGKQTTSVVTLDITEQHQAQQRSDLLLREMTTILESTTVGIAYLRSNMLVRCNSRFEGLLGFSAGEVVGCGLQELLAGQPEAAALVAEIDAAIAEDTPYETELSFDTLGRARQWCALSVRRVGNPQESLEVIAMLTDITRRKAQQLELEALARDRELMFSVSDVGIAFVRGDRIQRANEALSRLTGFEPGQLSLVHLGELFVNATEFARLRALAMNGMNHGGRWSGEHQLRRKDGTLVWVQVGQRLVVDGDPDGGFIASYVNVDDRHRAQQAVGLQAERTRAILDSVLVGIVTVGPQGIEWMNRSARRMFGGNLADFMGLPISTVATPEPEHPFRRTRYLNDLVEGQAETFECRVQARDGREFWVVGNAVATGRESTGRQLTYALLDIERRRQAEARIAEAQSSLQRIIEAAPLAITLYDARTLCVLQVNEVAAQSAERAPHEMIGHMPEDIFTPVVASQRRVDMAEALVALDVTQREYRVETHGEGRLWDARYLPLSNRGQLPDQLLLVATDVTEQRAAQEARFEAAIAQREMLVKEVHHRIKNNLQGVAGLLQQIGARKPEMAEAMSEVVGQVQAIAQVYGLQVGVTGPLRVTSVLEAICTSVQRTFGRNIVLHVEGPTPEVWVLPEAESIPIALTINELLTNAIKHSAGVGDGQATVVCRLVCGDTGVQIAIANPGVLAAGFNLARFPGGVSGLGLVRALLPRRSASLKVEQQPDEAVVVATIALVSPGVKRLEST
jgi:PAS domain S-box-containing protein